MRFDFIHCHGSGNDFPLIDARALSLGDAEWAGVARALSDRAGPVGGDGLLLLTEGRDGCDFGMRMFNPDGSEAELCLNGLRCVARLGFAALGIERARVRLIASEAEVARAPALGAGVFTVSERTDPAVAGAVEEPIAELGSARAFTRVWMPNPHLVAFVDAVDEDELAAIGLACEAAPDWLPERANVSFVEARGADTLFVRTFERGAGLTESCGSACAASVHAAALTGRVAFGAALTVRNTGGVVRAIAEENGAVMLEGNATWEWAGSAEVDAGAGVASGLVVSARFEAEVAAWAGVGGHVTGFDGLALTI